MKGRRYIESKGEDRVPLMPALIKTPHEEFLICKLDSHLVRGDKEELISTAEKIAKQQEMMPKVANLKELLLS